MRSYLPVSERAKAIHGEDPFEADLTASEERDEVDGGHLQIVPCAYKVLADNYSGGKQDEVIELALPVETEAALIQGRTLQRAEKPTPKSRARAGSDSNNEKG